MKIAAASRSVSLLLAGAAGAQPYPVKPVRLVSGFPAGGANDYHARVLAQKLTEFFGQTVIVENRGGAGGTIAADSIAKAAPDGYNLLMGFGSLSPLRPAFTPNCRSMC